MSSDSFSLIFYFLSISSPPFLRRPDFSFHVDSQPGSSLSLLEFKFLDCCQLSTPLLIARVVLSSFHSVFPHLSEKHFLLFFLVFPSFLCLTSPLTDFSLLACSLACLFLSQIAFHPDSPASFPVMFFIALHLTVTSVYPLNYFFSPCYCRLVAPTYT